MEAKTEFKNKVDETLNDWKSRLEDMEVQFTLGKMEASEELEEKKKEARAKVQELRGKMSASLAVAEDKWDDFSEEVGEAFDHLGKAFKKLVD